MMATSTTSVNSALARARKIVAEKVPSRTQQQTLRKIGDARLREIVTRYATARERGDAAALVALLTEDVTWSMPPLPHWYHGIEAVTDFAVQVLLTRCPSWRHLPASANGQPAVAFYVGNDGSGPHLAWSITVLTLRGEHIADITSFLDPGHFAPFGLPPHCPDPARGPDHTQLQQGTAAMRYVTGYVVRAQPLSRAESNFYCRAWPTGCGRARKRHRRRRAAVILAWAARCLC
jgi:SnoaL-like domain